MEALPRDILGRIAAAPSIARPLSFTCKALKDAMRGLFRMVEKSGLLVNWYCHVCHINGAYFSAHMVVSSGTGTVSSAPHNVLEFGYIRDEYLMVDQTGNTPMDPRDLILVEHSGRLYLTLAANADVVREFIGVLFTNIFTICGYHNNFDGKPPVERGDGKYYFTRDHDKYTRTDDDPREIRGGVTQLRLIHSATFCV